MPTASETGLFGILPERAPAARPMGAPRLRRAERRQVSLRPVSLEDLLPPDHRARFVWAFAERLDLSALYRAIKAVEGHPGHPPADPVGRSASNPAGALALRHGRGRGQRPRAGPALPRAHRLRVAVRRGRHEPHHPGRVPGRARRRDRKSTRLNSSHANISYAVFCLKKKKTKTKLIQ